MASKRGEGGIAWDGVVVTCCVVKVYARAAGAVSESYCAGQFRLCFAVAPLLLGLACCCPEK